MIYTYIIYMICISTYVYYVYMYIYIYIQSYDYPIARLISDVRPPHTETFIGGANSKEEGTKKL